MLRGSQAGFIGRHRGLAPCGSEAHEIPLDSTNSGVWGKDFHYASEEFTRGDRAP
jgi:hypothetical protein